MKLPKIKKGMPIGSYGFTLIEILLVVAILSILLVVVFAALNPAQRLTDARNARRWNDVNQVLTAVHECIIDNDLSTCGLSTTVALSQLGACASGGATPCTGAAAACLDLTTELANYISGMPVDPTDPGTDKTGYSIQVANGIVTVASCDTADAGNVSVSR